MIVSREKIEKRIKAVTLVTVVDALAVGPLVPAWAAQRPGHLAVP